MDVLPITHIVRDPATQKAMIGETGVSVAELIYTLETNPSWPIPSAAEKLNVSQGQIYAALSYYHDHPEEIEALWYRDFGPAAIEWRFGRASEDEEDALRTTWIRPSKKRGQW